MAEKKDPERREERGRDDRGPSVFPDEQQRQGRPDRDPEEEGSAGRSPS